MRKKNLACVNGSDVVCDIFIKEGKCRHKVVTTNVNHFAKL